MILNHKNAAQLLIEKIFNKIFNITNNQKLFFLMGDFNLDLTKNL